MSQAANLSKNVAWNAYGYFVYVKQLCGVSGIDRDPIGSFSKEQGNYAGGKKVPGF